MKVCGWFIQATEALGRYKSRRRTINVKLLYMYATTAVLFSVLSVVTALTELPQFITCKGKCKIRPRTCHEGSEGEQMYSSSHSLTSTLEVGGWSTPRSGRFSHRKDPVPIVQEAGWAPGTVWTGVENLASTGIRSPNRPGRSK